MNLLRCAAVSLLIPAVLAGSPAQAQNPAIATVNGTAIPRARADFMARQQGRGSGEDAAKLHAQIRDDLVNREVIAQEARRSGLLDKADVRVELDLMQQAAIVQMYLREWARANPVSDAEMQREYDTAKAQAGDTEYRARHILVETESEAQALLSELRNGAKFEALARKSRDTGTRAKGGDLGWAVPALFDKALGDAISAMRKGQLSDAPVRTRFGYHVIRLDDLRPMKFASYEDLRPQIQQRLMQIKIETRVRELRARARVE